MYIWVNELISIGFLKVGLLVKEKYEDSAEVKSPTKGAESSPDKKKQKTKK